MDKTAIKNYAICARRKLIQSAKDKAALIGVYEDKIVSPVSKGDGFEVYKSNIGTETRLNSFEVNQRNNLISKIKKDGFNQTIEEVAYTWFNRLIAIRFMEVNDYLPSRIRVLSSENQGQLESDLMLHPFESDIYFSNEEKQYILTLKETNKSDELFKFLFIKQCDDLSKYLPGLFVETKDYTKLLFDVRFNDQEDVIYKLVNEIPESNFNVELEGQIEIIGWLYQYYNTEPKEKVYARPKGQKIGKHDIPAVTQLFTPDWIVKYMVENSLGRLWLDGHPNESLKSNWRYYLDEAEQEESVQKELKKIREEHAKLSVEEIKLIDPCMGSGHILVYAFDVFMQLYLENGYSERDAAVSILKNNLYGLDIDERAYQLSYFALMMKARQYNRRIFTLGIKPNLYAFEETTQFIRDNLFRLGNLKELGSRISNDFENAKELGSIMKIHYTKEEIDSLNQKLDEIDKMADYGDLFTQADSIRFVIEFSKLVDLAKTMSTKYDGVVTNPPYMGPSELQKMYASKYYPNSKTDLFAMMIEQGNDLAKKNGYNCMVTMQAWMFLSSYEKMRESIISNYTISNLMQMENMVMGIAFGTAVTCCLNNCIKGYKGTYNHIKLCDIVNDIPNEFPVKKNRFSQVSADNFAKIPSSPIAYWLPKLALDAFNSNVLSDLAATKTGMQTCDNNRFLRLWFEVNIQTACLHDAEENSTTQYGYKWIPYNKGGDFRKWYGNQEYVLNWLDDGKEAKDYAISLYRCVTRTIKNIPYFYKETISWSKISSGNIAFRYYPKGFIFDVAGCCIYSDKVSLVDLMALVNSKVAKYYLAALSPTINFEAGHVNAIPVKVEVLIERISTLSKENITLAKNDWDSFETSWDFEIHPLVCGNSVEDAFAKWDAECEKRFNQLKNNEEELNRIFIDAYGLNDELTPEVEDKYVTVRKADLTRDIKSFISYAVGCMFGRYSLNTDGLAYAGGEWDDSKYKSFIPDKDNIIPICEEEYFGDDIVGRFIKFVETVYGKESLEANLNYIAKALGGSGAPKDVIRKYFLNDFFKDHCQTYQVTGSGKRPIYWQFDSGKQNGFKSLVYLHRYDEDLVSRVRTDYLHKVQNTYEDLIKNDEYTIEHSSVKSEVSSARKHMEKLQKQLAETKIYDQALAHIANQRIKLDLDDGVKVNYEKFQGVEVINEGSKTIKIDLLTKIK